MWIAIIASILSVIIVLYLSILTLNKGYGYQQTVDPLPEQENNKGNDKEEHLDSKHNS